MANFNLNCVCCFKQNSIVFYVQSNELHMKYESICEIQSKGKFNNQSYVSGMWQSYNH